MNQGNPDVTTESVKLFGMMWNRSTDTINTKPFYLDVKANFKRSISSTIDSNYDLYQFNGPMLIKARMFMHELQCSRALD